MSAYNPKQPSREPGKRSVLRWLAYYKPIVVEVVTDVGERERIVIDQKNTKRWDACYASMVAMNACTCRALDARDNVLGTYALREPPAVASEEDRPAVEHPATHQGVDVAAIMTTFGDILGRTVERVADKIVEAQKTAFAELTNITKASNERALISERERMRALDEREKRIEAEEERAAEAREEAEEERERIEEEREREREENASLKEMVQPLLAAAAPQIVGALFEKKDTSNGASAPAKVAVEAKPVDAPKKEPTPS